MKIDMSFLLISLTVIFWGAAPIFDKLAVSKAEPFLGVCIRGIFVGIIMFLTILFSGKIKEAISMPPKIVLLYVISGLLAGILGVFTYFKALQLSPASKVVPLSATYPLIAALLSVYFLGEALTISRIIGIILIIIGIWFVK